MSTVEAASGEGGVRRAALGPFVLERMIGSGGMGEVWRGVHRDEQVPVAIKVIGQHWARQPSYRQAFAREVRAVAGLVHAGIVAVFDQGVVGEAAARDSGHAIAADSPYLVMEYLPRGSLEGLLGALDWPLVQVMTRGILGALAYAHARGVVHCDLKPGNVLLSGITDVAIKLTDFGVAHALAPDDAVGEEQARSGGTPAYMAPEQLLGRWRDYGPWTDLYALGCMLWELCCGVPPFAAPDLVRLAGMHLHEPPGVFRPLFAAPPGLEGWLRGLLAKRPQARPGCAADAAWAFGRAVGSGGTQRLAWAEVAARRAEVDRAALTQPLPAAAEGAATQRLEGPATGRETAWSAAATQRLNGAATGRETAWSAAATRLLNADAAATGRETVWSAAATVVAARPDEAATAVAARPDEAAGAATVVAARPDEAAGGAATVVAVSVSDETCLKGNVVEDMSIGAGAKGQGRSDMVSGTGARSPAGSGEAPPVPASWRGPGDAALLRPLHGAGLALYRFREVPLVGREAERDALWAALAAVQVEGRARAVLVRGPSGVGKSRLALWLATRAQELGAAVVLRATHGPFGGPGEGLPRMLATHLQCVGLAGDEAYARVLGILGEGERTGERTGEALRYEAAALTEFMLPGGEGERPRVRLAEQRERNAVLAGYLRRLCARRPALLWFDDAMWGPEALEFTRHLLGAGPRALVVLTVRDDLLAERPAEARLLAELAALPGVSTLDVAPLAEDEHRALIHERLGLDAGLVEAVLARAGGNPLFSVQLVGDWIARGLLTNGPGGFNVAADAAIELPDDLHALWQERLARLLAQHYSAEDAAAARQALELAAALGLEIEAQAWARGLELEGLRPPAGLVELLLAQRLALTTRSGWAFVHGMLRESLERLAAAAGRKAMHHRTCAEILRALHGGHAQGHAEEVARHLIAAGELAAAMEPLLDATYQMQLSGQYDRAERVLGEHAALADRLELPHAEVRRLRGRMQAVWLTWMRGGEGSLALARARCREVEVAARQGGHDDVLGEALRWHGLVGRFERRFEESLGALTQAAAAFERAGDPGGQARTALARSVTLRALGQLDAAEAELVAAGKLAVISELSVLLPRIAGNLAEIALQRGDWAAAQTRFAAALAAAEALGDRKALALTLGGAGDLALARGKLEEADARYARAEALFASLGSRYVHGVRLHRATITLLRGSIGPARRFMLEFIDAPDRDPLSQAHAQLGLALGAGLEGQLDELERRLAAAERHLERVGETRRVIVLLIQAIADAVGRVGGWTRAQQLKALAQTHEARLHAAPA